MAYKYMPFTDLKGPGDLRADKETISLLDEDGLNLTRKIAQELEGINVERFMYFSYGQYYFVSIDSKGNEIQVLNPTKEDWNKV
jgi:hypothetical protein|tara:strand:+ start:485 stop:736 length:252 start_codon:yes stop_codon:yes gene_type:complete